MRQLDGSEGGDGQGGGGLSRTSVILGIVAFWLCQFASQTAQSVLMDGPVRLITPRACVSVAAVLISVAIWQGYRRLLGQPMRVRIAAGIGFALVGCVVHSLVNFTIFQFFLGQENLDHATLNSYASALLFWFWTYAALSALLLGLSYAIEVNRLRQATHTAQIRALRYQLNPHFMFNTLNSIAALIGEKRLDTAEAMVENLADFLRATLSLDPETDIPLEQELQLQSLYMAIEALRFSDRLETDVSIAPAALPALVPALITQPLAENVIRHAVANSTRTIRFELSADVVGDTLRIRARNTPPDGEIRSRTGTGVGLRNIAERLRARFGPAGRMNAGRDEDGSFSVEIALPYVIS